MADELYVLNEGVNIPTDFTATPSAYNTNTSINPNLITKNQTSSDIDGNGTHTNYINCYEIHDVNVIGSGDMAANMALGDVLNRYHPSGSTVEEYGLNLVESPGHRITVDVSLTTSQLAAHDYFVIINADNPKRHVAKITDVSTYEGTKTNIDFTPALKENVAYGVKICIYQGPDIEGSGKNVDTVVAVSYGLLQEVASNGSVTEHRNGNFVQVSSPTFYFYRDIEPDRKYVVFKQTIAQASSSSTQGVSLKQSVFKTAPVTSNFIVDKSFYSQNATLVDNNKIGDEAATPVNYTQYDGTTGNYTLDITGWATSAKNYDFAMGSSTTTYPTYIKPITSPVKNQYMAHLMGVNLNRSITNKGNMAEVKFIDPERMLERKVNDYENFNVKEVLGKETMAYKPEAVLPGTYNGSGSTITVTGLEKGVDLSDLLGSSADFELIYIGDYYYKLSAISAVSGGEQTLTVSDRRLFSAFKFEGSSTVATMTNATAYRNAWSTKVQNLIVTHDIDTVIDSGTLKRGGITLENTESDINGIEYIVAGEGIVLTVKRGDKLANYVELEDNKLSSYLSNHSILNSIKGELVVNKKVFKGKAEFIETDTEYGIFSLTISGRDEIATLLDYPINKNLLYSKEWVASTISPITDTFTDTGLDVANTTDALNVAAVDTVGTSTVALTFGDVIYLKYDSKYIPLGVVSQDYPVGTSNAINLMNDSLIDTHVDFNGSDTLDNSNIYVGKNKLLAGKSLHNHYRTTPHESLYGAADKGMVFYGTGKTINKTGSSATSGVSITSLNNPDNDVKNYGMDINNIVALEGSSDSPKDSPYGLDFDYRIVGSLSNMHLIGEPTELDNGETVLEMGNISPIVMARMDINSLDTFFTNSIGMYFLNKQGIDRGGFIHLLDHINDSENKGSTWRRLCVDDRKQQTNATNYAFRFGSPIFRFNNFTDSKLTGIRNIPDNRNSSTTKTYINDIYKNKPNMVSGYASAIRVMGSGAISKTYYKDYTNSWQKEKPIEQTWRYPANGSLHQDITIYDNAHRNAPYNYSNRLASNTTSYTWVKSDKQLFEMDDPMCEPLFLFAPGDMLPESQKRPDHIFFNGSDSLSRNTSDYFLLIKYRDVESETFITHDNYEGATNFTKPLSNNYDLLPINNNLDIVPKRFNLLRMVPVTYDSYMNEVDYETYPIKSTIEEKIAGENEPARSQHCIAQSVPRLGNSVYRSSTTSATSTSNPYIDVTTTLPFNSNTFNNIATGGSSGASNHIHLFTDPASDSTGYSRFLGYADYTDASTTATRIYLKTSLTNAANTNCLIDGYEGEILVVEEDDAFGIYGPGQTITDNEILKNKNSFEYPFTLDTDVRHNHNIHRLNGFNEYFLGTIRHTGSSALQIETTADVAATLFKDLTISTDLGHAGGFGHSYSTNDVEKVISSTTIQIGGSGLKNTDGSAIAAGTSGSFKKRKRGDFIYFNYRQKNMYRGTKQFKHKGNIRFQNRTADVNFGGTDYDTIEIEFEGFTNTQIDLTNHFAVNDTLTISGVVDVGGSGSTETDNNTNYVVTAVNDSGLPSAGSTGKIVVRATDATNLVNTTAYQSGILIVNTTTNKSVTNMGCHPNRFINNMCRREKNAGGSSPDEVKELINTFNGLAPVLVYAGDSKAQDFDTGSRGLIRDRRKFLRDITNVGIELKHDGSSPEHTGTNYGGVTDIIELEAEQYWNHNTTELDDAILLFKPKINGTYSNVSTWEGSNSKYTASTGGNEGFIRIEVEMDLDNTNGSWTTKDLRWIDFVPNLTGKILVKTSQEFTGSNASRTVKGNETNTHNILNHTISKAESSVGTKNVHYLHIDNYSNLNLAAYYEVHKFATQAIKSDKTAIALYNFSRLNIINPLTNEFFTDAKSEASWYNWEKTAANDEYKTFGFENNGSLLGMYVVAELDGAGSASLVHRNDTSLFVSSSPNNNQWQHDTTSKVYITDGIEKLATSMTILYRNIPSLSASRVILNFADMKDFVGSVSIGSIFSLNVSGNIKSDVEYVKIVTPFNVAPEAEQAVDEIMSQNNISYTVSNNTNKYYAGNNFTGQDSYTASNILLENKDLKLNVNGDSIKVVSNEENKDFRAIEISEENTTIKVTQVKKDKSLLDNYNEVVVYGDGHKGIARNYSDMKKRKKTRTKEVFDYSIITQKEVDQKAVKVLKLYSSAQNAIELTIANDLPFLEPGNIITLHYPSEGIRRGNYTVIEIEKTLGMPTKLLLGQYNKDLSNTLSGLLSVTKNLQGNTKRKIYASVYVPNVSVQTTKFKFIQAKVTSNTGTPAIGFTYTIGFDAGIEP